MTNIATLTNATADLNATIDTLKAHLLTQECRGYLSTEHFMVDPKCDKCTVLTDEWEQGWQRVHAIFEAIRAEDGAKAANG